MGLELSVKLIKPQQQSPFAIFKTGKIILHHVFLHSHIGSPTLANYKLCHGIIKMFALSAMFTQGYE